MSSTTIPQKEHKGWRDSAWYSFVRSNYITAFTDWFLGLGGKSAQVVLIITTLYMSAELYPGVHLPDGLNLTVFLVQMFALDMGCLGLGSLARQAEKDGNADGAKTARKFSKWLIAIMIAGLVTVALKQAISLLGAKGPFIGYVNAGETTIELVLVIARAVSAVLYGKVVHALEGDDNQTLNVTQLATLEQRLNNQIIQIQTESSQSVAQIRATIETKIAGEVAQLKDILGLQIGRSVAENLATMRQNLGLLVAQTVAGEVAQIVAPTMATPDSDVSEKIGYLVELVNQQAQTIKSLTNALADTRREFRTMVTEIRSITQEMPALPAGNPANTVEASSQNLDESSQNASEKGKQVLAFLTTWKGPKKATLQQIMDTCEVAKKTAVYWRRQYYGSQTEDEE